MDVLLSTVGFLYHTVCGWIGNAVVKVCTFGKVEFDRESGTESALAEAVGAIFLLLVGILLYRLWG